MDKKNTMLLTVIAVATLLVAVVGATFAFFAVNNDAGSASTTATAQAKAIPVIAVNQKENKIGMVLTATDMQADALADVKYYASAGESTTPIKGEQNNIEIATISAANGESTDTYQCDVTLDVTVSAPDGMLTGEDALGEGNVNLILSGDLFTKTIDLTKGTTKETTTLSIKGSGDADKSIKAALEIVNKKETDQSKAAGKTLTVTIATSANNCHLVTD